MQKLNRAERMLSMELRWEPTLEESAERAGLPLGQALEVEAAAGVSISLDQPLAEQDHAFGDLVSGEEPLPPHSGTRRWCGRSRSWASGSGR